MSDLILASSSVQRKSLLDSLDLEFSIIPANIDEKSIRDEDLSLRVEKIALAKANFVAKDNQDSFVVAADTFLVLPNLSSSLNSNNLEVLEKPNNENEAAEMLAKISGREVFAYTGLVFKNISLSVEEIVVSKPKAKILNLSESKIKHYIKTNPVTTWAGGFSPAYSAGASLVECIEGSMTAFTHGIPMDELVPILTNYKLLK